ncbi:MMPL family transporter [Rummeliibacillus pycnus]|uniref:MMPL family transporter n=1 Tax=Rummeliibacillus pycnus TaxID=101070 RepID=UPI000C9ADF31|nr:MMPL family transporter [Rummeliibacillus pycnus]
MKKDPFELWGSLVSGKKSHWMTLIIWVLLVTVLSFIWPQVNSIENASTNDLPKSMMSQKANELMDKEFSDGTGNPLLLVWHRNGALKDEDLKAIQRIYIKLEDDPLSAQKSIPPLGKVPLQSLKASVSENGTTIVTPIFFDSDAQTDVLKKNVDDFQKIVKSELGKNPTEGKLSTNDLHLRLSGPVGIQLDAVNLFSQADVKLMIATVLLVLVLLILLYRSPLLAIIPLIVVGFAYGIISPALGYFAEQGWISKDAQAVSIMTVLLFGAGTDYCLFLISKYREILFEVEDRYKAMKIAVKESGGAIAMSALTVVIGLLTLSLAHYGSFQRFSVPFSFAVLLMGIASLTVLPALLVVIGRIAFYPFIPRTVEMEKERAEKKGKPYKQPKPQHRFSRRIGEIVTVKPWIVILTTLILLGGLAAGVTKIQFTFDLLSSFPKDMASREGFQLISDNFSPGELAPVKVIVNTDQKNMDLQKNLKNLSYVDEVKKPIAGKHSEELQLYELYLAGNPYSSKAIEHIPELKKQVVKILNNAGVENASEHVWIGGETATQYDTKRTIERDESIIMPTMIAIIALLLLVYLRSITATVYLIFTVVLSYFAALGAGWLVLHYFFGADAIQGSIPLYSFVFLVALGEDYNIFMVSEIWKKRKTQDHQSAVSDGVVHTSNVITSAGLILAGTFAVLATLPIQVLVQFGVVTAIGVLLDTFIVRPLLVPALTTVSGKYAFWPGKLFRTK